MVRLLRRGRRGAWHDTLTIEQALLIATVRRVPAPHQETLPSSTARHHPSPGGAALVGCQLQHDPDGPVLRSEQRDTPDRGGRSGGGSGGATGCGPPGPRPDVAVNRTA